MKRRRLGQHYLVDPAVVQLMISLADLRPTETVVEIGTGKGILTGKLASLCAGLDGYEVDPENYRETLARLGEGRARIHLADAFDERPIFDVLVASLPYSRSLDFVEWVSQVRYDRGVVLLQEDFVRKVLSPPGSRDYRGVSAVAQISSEMKGVERVSRTAFQPPPKVSSLLVTIKPKLRLTQQEISDIKKLFSLRRRQVSTALPRLGFPGVVDDYGTRRVSSLTPEEVHSICRAKVESGEPPRSDERAS